MKIKLTEDEIFATIAAGVAEALRVDAAKISMASRLFLDLGAESIDILDIRFRIEHALGFKIDQAALIRSLGEGLSAGQIQEQLTLGSLVAYVRQQLQQQP